MSEITLKNLNKEQQAAVTHENGPLLIVAGAGTGKTTVVTQRIAWLIQEQHLQPDNVLALTFTEKAAGEMEERVDKALPLGYMDLWISTFHAFAERILKQHALDIGLPQDFKVLSQTESWLLVKRNLEKFDLDYYRPMGNPNKFIHALLQHFSRCKDEEIYPENYIAYADELKMNRDDMEGSGGKAKRTNDGDEDLGQEVNRILEVANAYHVYQQLLLEHAALDFGDLIMYCLKLFKTRPHILKQYQKKFQYILVDEFQDTNWAQYELVKLLASKHKNITVVGDDDQSIYKFRGASVSNILNFKKDYPKSREIFLQTNYRSPQNILDMSYNFITNNNPDRLEVKLAGNGKQLSKKLHAHKEGSGTIEYIFAEHLEAEVSTVAEKILSLYEQDKEINWSDFAILVRANDAAQDFVHEFEQRQIPYQFLAARGLYQKQTVRDIVNYLRLLDDYREAPALYRILNMPVLDISQYQISNLMYWAGRKSWSVFEVLKQIQTIPKVHESTLQEVQKLVAWIDTHTELAKSKSVLPVILTFLEDSQYIKYIENLEPLTSKQLFDQLNQFLKKVKDFEKNSTENKVSDFLEEFEMELESGDTGSIEWDIEEGPDTVRIMTVHAAKGLEFPYVFIPNLVDKRFPTIRRSEPIELPDALVKDILPEGDSHVQEERRLMYVALTRARQGLFLSGAQDYGGARAKKPSLFVKELGLAGDAGTKKPTKTDNSFTPKKTSAKTQDKEYYKPPDKFSFTQIKAYQSCPLQYKYAHVLKIPIKGRYTFSFGKSIHSTLQRFFELVKHQASAKQGDLFSAPSEPSVGADNISASLDDLLSIYNEVWIDEWYDNKKQREEYKQKGQEALKEFYAEWQQEKQVPEYLEKGFNVRIKDHTIKGVIDRIDVLPNGKWEVVDYKTGKSKSDKQVDKTQLLIYQLAVKQVFKQEPEKLTFYYIEDGKKVSFLGGEKDLEKLEQQVVETIEKIMSGDFTPTPSPHVCKYCDFKDICDFSQG